MGVVPAEFRLLSRNGETRQLHLMYLMYLMYVPYPHAPDSLPSPYPPRDPTTSGRSKRTNRPFNCCSESVGLVVRPMPMLVVGLYGLTPLNQNEKYI